ncbi:MAG: efflux RND transporter periplasmic adaptor subunit [Mesorhizobium sp.]|nr:efflux RND transporter periplasmic adaptor subunit [Mesorhizobium sp.]AZO63135.1 efflux RND transporter periplasmic adaptor subunit [Mesorhizobium sp. M1A.F.Ca.IN.022.06.1.1]RUV24199.1 efflux RND transporter periplasmic adaptor subunit [Mesorhizobium sp. M1A.F.Ca.IN.022.04.1.1]RUV56890.1 efflux RND transporter periplasmic adaptor subunit [Mesorhizobium sp. M1A.F.Ca.IN.022.02.1.1]RWG25725.1 MAG: efflux RND transporter periplasmic adaptor subunit [Mesorhizobium sp.]RWG65263.1 MAG: efflux RND 
MADIKPVVVRRRRRGWMVALLLVAAGAGVAFWLHPAPVHQQGARGGQRFRGGDLGAQPVAVASVTQADIPITLEALGTVTSLSTVTVRPQVSGQITAIAFTEGEMVKKGDFLAQVDDRTLQASLHQLQGQLKHDQALLTDARLDLDRDLKLTSNAITQQAVDLQRATVQSDEGTVMSDQAQIEAVEVNIANSHIVAPADGRIGLRLVDQGNYVTPSDSTGIAVITEMQPISVLFSLPEDTLAEVLEQTHGNAGLKATLFDRNDTKQIAEGTLQTIDNQIDPTTGTVKLRAVFANADGGLYPNQFVNVHLLVRTLTGVTVLPNAAIQHGAPGTFVYQLNDDSTVSVKTVSLGPGDASVTQLLSGLPPGAKVVVDGVDRLKDGAKVTVPDNSAAPTAGAGSPAQPQAEGRGSGAAATSNTSAVNPGNAPAISSSQGQGSAGGGADASGDAGRKHHRHHRRDGSGNSGSSGNGGDTGEAQ